MNDKNRLTRRKAKNHFRRWTYKEEEIVKKGYYEHKSTRQIAEEIGRTPYSVWQRVFMLKNNGLLNDFPVHPNPYAENVEEVKTQTTNTVEEPKVEKIETPNIEIEDTPNTNDNTAIIKLVNHKDKIKAIVKFENGWDTDNYICRKAMQFTLSFINDKIGTVEFHPGSIG